MMTTPIRHWLPPLLAVLALALPAAAAGAAPADEARALLATLQNGPTPDAANAATKLGELAAASADVITALEQHLARERSSTDDERRAALGQIGAEVPDEKGRFRIPGRGVEAADPNLDWLTALVALPAGTPGLGDLVSDVAAIRALAASDRFAAGDVIFNYAFTAAGEAYRDECGRYLRKMAPTSLPGLIRGSRAKHSKGRYARYQLERLDRQSPPKALLYAPDERTRVAILAAWNDVHHPDAVQTVLATVDDVNPAVRAAARKTWLGYVTGKAPPEAPKRKLVLPGGKLSDEEMPLYLNYRELATIELKRVYEEVLGKKPRGGLKQLSDELFSHYDGKRATELIARLDEARSLAEAGKLAEATAIFDTVLRDHPDHEDRAAMGELYFAYAESLAGEAKWIKASVAYAKAAELAPAGANAKAARAGRHYARAQVIAASGGDPSAEVEKALEILPDHPGASKLADRGAPPPTAGGAVTEPPVRPSWMLYLGVLTGLIAIALAVVAIRRRHP